MKAMIINDPNAGNGPGTYWRSGAKYKARRYSVKIGDNFLRDSRERVRRFLTREAAIKAAHDAGYSVHGCDAENCKGESND